MITSMLHPKGKKTSENVSYYGPEILSDPVLNFDVIKKSEFFVYYKDTNKNHIVLMETQKELPSLANVIIVNDTTNKLNYSERQKVQGPQLSAIFNTAYNEGRLRIDNVINSKTINITID